MPIVYVLHLDTPMHHAKHYTGFSKNERTLAARIQHHRDGHGSKFTQAVVKAGIDFCLALKIKGRHVDKNLERKLKKTKNVVRYCPICNEKARAYHPKKVKP